METVKNQKQKQGVAKVEIPGSRNQALASIDLHILRFIRETGKRVTLVQVGKALFEAAFPDRVAPHKIGEIGDVCVFPRPDLLEDWELRPIPKPE